MSECRRGNACHLAGGRPTTSGSIALILESPYNTCTDFAAESSYQREASRYVPPPTISNQGAKNMNALKYSSPKACIMYFIHFTLERIIGFGRRQDHFERRNIGEICAGELFIGGRCCLTSESRS